MPVRRLFIGNFDFEYCLAGYRSANLPKPVRRRQRELACVWTAMAAAGDLLWMPASPEASFFEELRRAGLPRIQPVSDDGSFSEPVVLSPWGWTEDIRRWGHQRGLHVDAPAQEAVREANTRRFSAQLEEEWNLALPGAKTIRSMETFRECLAALPEADARWVLKAEFSTAARERILGQGREPSVSAINWVRKHLAADRVVFFEPWVDALQEAGLQFTVPRCGPPIFDGLTPLLTHTGGSYAGNRFSTQATEMADWQRAIHIGRQAAERLQSMGYFGPVGIDAMRYRDDSGEIRLRPLQDVNARSTMGRLSLGFRRVLASGECGSWLHVTWPIGDDGSARDWWQQMSQAMPAGVRLLRTSPFFVGDDANRTGTLVVIASSLPQLHEAEERIRTSAANRS